MTQRKILIRSWFVSGRHMTSLHGRMMVRYSIDQLDVILCEVFDRYVLYSTTQRNWFSVTWETQQDTWDTRCSTVLYFKRRVLWTNPTDVQSTCWFVSWDLAIKRSELNWFAPVATTTNSQFNHTTLHWIFVPTPKRGEAPVGNSYCQNDSGLCSNLSTSLLVGSIFDRIANSCYY